MTAIRSCFSLLQGVFIIAALCDAPSLGASDNGGLSAPIIQKSGMSLQLVPESSHIVPGRKFSIGLIIRHQPNYHTYWKQPGIVGLPSTIKWDLPKGWKAGPLVYPEPQRTKMAAWGCWGYERDVCLITEIEPAATLNPDKQPQITLKGHYTGMCCATECNLTHQDLALTLPIKPNSPPTPTLWAPHFAQTRAEQPTSPLAGWKFLLKRDDDSLSLTIQPPTGQKTPTDLFLFGYQRLIDSHQPQRYERTDSRASLTLKLCDLPEEGLHKLNGQMYASEGWPNGKKSWTISMDLPTSE